ncbi:MAG: hypothetical protein KAT58_03925 [candidate division Zixibacteria bacterium]|nr:hypothetical protein [candidate division Zixibacteria bacterium]
MEEEFVEIALAKVRLLSQSLPERGLALHGYLITNFGQTITLAIYLTAVSLVLLALFRSIKFSFDLLRWVVVPTAAVGLIGSLVLPYSFLTIAPLAAIVFSSVLLLKG